MPLRRKLQVPDVQKTLFMSKVGMLGYSVFSMSMVVAKPL